jgi:hypothetical protein
MIRVMNLSWDGVVVDGWGCRLGCFDEFWRIKGGVRDRGEGGFFFEWGVDRSGKGGERFDDLRMKRSVGKGVGENWWIEY